VSALTGLHTFATHFNVLDSEAPRVGLAACRYAPRIPKKAKPQF
jgi:hypothetical protein